MTSLAWREMPDIRALSETIQAHARPLNLIICNLEAALPQLKLPEAPSSQEQTLYISLLRQINTLALSGVHVIEHLLPDVHFWWLNDHAAYNVHEHFSQVQWQTPSLSQQAPLISKPWFIPAPTTAPTNVLVIGAGIAGAATARALAERNIASTVLETEPQPALAASGNRQGLLYAKISPHPTEQSELLLSGYGYTRRLLERLLPHQHNAWDACGVLHINHNAAETRRNAALSLHTHHHHLYHAVSATEASDLAGIAINHAGLFWPQGAWLHPPALVHALLEHPLISLHTNTPLLHAYYHGNSWFAQSSKQLFSGSHIVFCSGSASHNIELLKGLPFQLVRGQTSLATANNYSQQLRCALSGTSYIAPAWQGQHCYGATFMPNDTGNDWRESDEQLNHEALIQLHPTLATSFHKPHTPNQMRGHASIRCDAPDHLPMVGELGDITAMQDTYAQLALDKNQTINSPCPYLPNAYLNTAHGSRGLSTAPLCGASIAAQIAGTPNPLSKHLRQALHPNRSIIRSIIRHKPVNI